MKILFFEDSSQSIYGGGQKISKIILEKLIFDNVVILVDFKGSVKFQDDIKNNVSSLIILKTTFFKNKLIQRISQFFYFILNLIYVIRITLKNKPDLIYTATKTGILYSFFLNIFFGKKFIFHAHMSMEKSFLNYILCYILKRANNTIAVSNYVKNTIIQRNNNVKICVIHNPIEFSINKLNINKTEIINFSFFGTLKTEKGIELIVKAANYFQSNYPKIQFSIYGDGPLKNDLISKNIPNMCVHGHIDNVEDHLESTDVLLLPSIIPEACPTIILQAMSKGIPTITSNIGGQKELVIEKWNGLLINKNDLESLIYNIVLINSDIELYNFLANNNISEIKKYNSLNDYKIKINNIINESITVR